MPPIIMETLYMTLKMFPCLIQLLGSSSVSLLALSFNPLAIPIGFTPRSIGASNQRKQKPIYFYHSCPNLFQPHVSPLLI
jgi:hypothetical protein